MKVLVTGGAGYIGSHTLIELDKAGHDSVVVDNLSNSSVEAIRRVSQIIGKPIKFIQADVCDETALQAVFETYAFDAVIHFAGLKSVAQSVTQPLAYYHNNIASSLTLCKVMQLYNVKQLIFSSSATVYGTPESLPLTEASRTGLGITNPYGQTKYMIEQILQDLVTADSDWKVTILRYFNPIGAHVSGQIGEDPNGVPNNLLPYISQVAVGKLDRVQIYGQDYDTPDGTGMRDYIHVCDLAAGHVAALERQPELGNIAIYNLGTGKATSVLQLVKAFETACGKNLPYAVTGRRTGDIATCYADITKAQTELRWMAQKSIEDACADAWHWQSMNPNGYEQLAAIDTP